MKFDTSGMFSPTIRSRLLFSFFLVAFIALCATVTAWLLLNKSETQSQKLLDETMPHVSLSQDLGKEIAFFTTFSKDLANLNSTSQFHNVSAVLSARIQTIKSQLDLLKYHKIDEGYVEHFQKYIAQLDTHFNQQLALVNEYLKTQDTLARKLSSLEEKHGEFKRIVGPRISANYKDFIDQGKDVVTQLQTARDYLGDVSSNSSNQIRPTIETLVNTVAGELRSNHEIIAATYEATGLLYEAAGAPTVARVGELDERFQNLLPRLKRLQLILSYTPPENSRVLVSALPIIRTGQGESSVFSLRSRELELRLKVAELTNRSVSITSQFADLARELSEVHQTAAEDELEKLNSLRERAKIIQVLAGIGVLLVSIFISWFYVGNQVIARLDKLKKAMNLHAKGLQGDIPLDGDDEITDMAHALASFVRQRSEVEAALHDNVELLNEAQQIAKFGSCIRQSDGTRWEWSAGFYELIGCRVDELSASEENFWDHVHSDDRDNVQQVLLNFCDPGQHLLLDFRMQKNDNSTCSVSTRWKYTPQKVGQTESLHGTLFDVSERKRIEAELHRIQKLESIGVLAGGIAHDFNNLLTAIIGNISLASIEAPKNPEVQNHLLLAETAAFRARDLTQRLLTFSRGGDPVKSWSDLSLVLEEAVALALSGSNVNCSLRVVDGLWPVNIDPSQMSQVLQNLIVNADQAMEDGGTISITSANVIIDSAMMLPLTPGHYVKVEVKDQGSGIQPEHLKSIFDPYFTTKEMNNTKGSGLGLAIVHSIIQKHEGHIEVYSKPNQGAVFTLYLPALPEAKVQSPEVKQKSGQASGSILVMDDEEIVRMVVKAMLEKLGYEVLLTQDGAEAVEVYIHLLERGKKPDVVVMDLTVPGGMGGKQAAEQILARDPEARLIVSSGYSNEDVLLNFREFGFSGVASKPYNMTELAKILSEIVV